MANPPVNGLLGGLLSNLGAAPNVGQTSAPGGLPPSMATHVVTSFLGGAVPRRIDGVGTDVVDFSNFQPGAPGAGLVVRAGASGLEFRPAIDRPADLVVDKAARLVGSGFGDDVQGGAGLDRFEGGLGDDILRGLSLKAFDGGAGADVVDLSGHARGATIDFVLGRIADHASEMAIANVERAIGTRFNDVVRGGGADETICDTGGNDDLDGGEGVNTLAYLDDGVGALRGIVANLAANFVQDVKGGVDTVRNFQNLAGSRLADTLAADRKANWLFGDAGNDSIYGDRGSDTIDAGAGDDLIAGSDFAEIDGIDVDVLLGGLGNDQVYVGKGAKAFVFGGADDDTLVGGDKDDWVALGKGRDVVFGGKGADAFVFNEGFEGVDSWAFVADFSDGVPGRDFDAIYLPEVARAAMSIVNVQGGAWIGLAAPGSTYGIMVAGATAANLADQIFFI